MTSNPHEIQALQPGERSMSKNCKISIPAAVVLAGVLGLWALAVGGCKSGRSGGGEPNAAGSPGGTPSPATSQATGEAMNEEPVALPPTPDIAMDVDSQSELSLYQGAPMIFTVRLANQRASNVLFQNAAIAADTRPANPQPVPVVQLAAGWTRLVRFEVRAAGGAEPVTWPLSAIGEPATQPVALGGTTNPDAQWGLSPEAAGKLSPGVYRIVAVLEASGKDTATWQGRVESEPVLLTIQARPANLQGPAAVEPDLNLARYWAQTQDWGKSLEAARQAVQSDPNSIEGHTLVGDALAARNDPAGALSAYGTAMYLFDQKHKGKEYEQPDYLVERISQILRANPPKDPMPRGDERPTSTSGPRP
jgi:hypothetical protein